jgi:cyclic pyranopterin phosphate synthase
MPQLLDNYGRSIDYLRISITDHCNLNCFYCTPFGGRFRFPHAEILSYEEIFKVTKAAVLAGVSKVRITGGEPLMRKEMIRLCRMLTNIQQLKSLTLTTNGILLEEMAKPLFDAGVRRVNVSLDTLKPERFMKITGRDLLSRVLDGIKKAEEVGLHPIKINTVVMRGINDDEVEDLACLTLKKPYHVRFIELMPTDGWAKDDHESLFVPVEEIVKLIKHIVVPHLDLTADSFGPARLCNLPGGKGKVGFIGPMTRHFCDSCNRLRLTADGKLRTCLFSKEEIDIKGPLRSGASMEELASIFRTAVAGKPAGHYLQKTDGRKVFGRAMHAIGG